MDVWALTSSPVNKFLLNSNKEFTISLLLVTHGRAVRHIAVPYLLHF